jgi:ABC-type antimicrobial peptide transport system permease subunit
MFKNYFKTAWRNLIKNKAHSLINITGLAVGMAVAILIGLWIYDEVSYNKSFANYDHIAQIMQNSTFDGDVNTQQALPYVMGDELRRNFGSDFKNISMATWTGDHILAYGENKISKSGNYMEPQITDMLSLQMIEGTRGALQDNHSILLSASTAKALFGNQSPLNKTLKIDNQFDVKVTGVYKDLPYNSDFKDLTFIGSWQLFIDNTSWLQKFTNPWSNNSFQVYVQLADNVNMQTVSAKIKDAKLKRVSGDDAAAKPQLFLQPMSKWHLYSEFKNGVSTGGRITFVWMFGIIGFFVLLLACINFMNLSTARSEKRAKEVGVRKAIGSLRVQLIRQFFAESILVTLFAFVISIALALLVIPSFNQVADKRISIPWSNPFFWLTGFMFTLFTGFIAGSYPAFYLSSFSPVKVLKGTFRVGRLASLPRKVLVVLQFTVSIILIIGTIVVFNQIQFAKNRPVGYNRNSLITIPMSTENIHDHFEAVKNDLQSSGAIAGIAESSSATTWFNETDAGFEWQGNSSSTQTDFNVVYVSTDFGKTIGWKVKEGRDFSSDFATDSSGIILNETAVKYMGLKNPVGENIRWLGKPYHVIGVVNDMITQSPYDPVPRSVFVTNHDPQQNIDIRINPSENMHDALAKIETVFKKYNPEQPFIYKFNDEEYAKKFGDEERIGKLAGFFAALAIFISCLGLFGMASFMAEQRVKEIGVRKVLGASVFNLWGLLSKDFVAMVLISFLIATPVAYYFMHNWLQNYQYRTNLSWWIFAVTGVGAVLITLLTVSFQSIKAAIANPVKSLRTE